MTKYEEYTAKVEAMPEKTEAQQARKAKAKQYLANVNNDSGAYGRITELLNTYDNSNKKGVSAPDKNDGLLHIVIDGRVRCFHTEEKTNGGRIENLLDGSNRDKFIRYTLDICNSGTSHKRRVVPTKVFLTSKFLEMLETYGKIKNTNGTNPERAIEPTSKTWYNALLNYPIDWDKNRIYTLDEFDI